MEKFQFKQMAPSEELRVRAFWALTRVEDKVPSNAVVSGILEQVGDTYLCSFEVSALAWPISVSASCTTPELALERAELKIMRKLEKWRRNRFFARKDSSLASAGQDLFSPPAS